MEANVEAESVTPNSRMGGWCSDAFLGSCAYGAVGMMGMKRRPGLTVRKAFMEQVGLEQEKHFGYENDRW